MPHPYIIFHLARSLLGCETMPLTWQCPLSIQIFHLKGRTNYKQSSLALAQFSRSLSFFLRQRCHKKKEMGAPLNFENRVLFLFFEFKERSRKSSKLWKWSYKDDCSTISVRATTGEDELLSGWVPFFAILQSVDICRQKSAPTPFYVSSGC